MEDPLVPAILAQGLVGVALCEMDRDEHAMGALAERVTIFKHRGEAGLNRLAVSTKRQETPADGVEPVEAELPQPLAFDQNPVVGVPVGQELARQRGGIQVRGGAGDRLVQEPANPGGDLPRVDRETVRKP
jgi:hypothetical protein